MTPDTPAIVRPIAMTANNPNNDMLKREAATESETIVSIVFTFDTGSVGFRL